MPMPFLLDALVAVLSLLWLADCAGRAALCGVALLLFACAVQAWYEAAIMLRCRLFVPSWVRVLKYCALCAATAGALLCDALPVRLLCLLLGFASLLFADRAALPDRRVTLWAVAAALPDFAAATVRRPEDALRNAAALAAAWALACAVRWLTLRLGGEGAAPPAPEPEELAWTQDGYLKDQDALSAYSYRSIPACQNGCGPVAAFNLRRFAGQDVRLADVLAEMDAMHPLRVPGPTHHYVMRRYLRAHLPGSIEARGRSAALEAASGSRMGVYRYLEQLVPHYVAYIRVDGGFRFFNVSDDLEDGVLSMERFGAEHLLGGDVKLICWK